MFNRTLILLSASIAIIIIGFTFIGFYMAFDSGVFTNDATGQSSFSYNNFFIAYIIFVGLMLLGAILNFIAYNKKSINILVFATIAFIFSGIPTFMLNSGLNGTSSDDYLFIKFSLPSVILNFLQMIFIKIGVKNYKSGLSGLGKSNKNKK